MELSLKPNEVEVLREALQQDIKELLRELTHTDHRELREELKKREELLEGVLKKLSSAVSGDQVPLTASGDGGSGD